MAAGPSIRDTFFEECEELLEALSEGLTDISDGQQDSETVNAVFRAVHSIKGGAGAFGLEDLVGFAHSFETVFDAIRSGDLEMDAMLIALLFRAGDHLADLVEAARDETETDAAIRAEIITALEAYLDPADLAEEEFVFEAMTLDLPVEVGVVETTFNISFRPHKALFKNGHEPLFLLQELSGLGACDCTLDYADLPTFDAYEPDESYLCWTIVLTTEKAQAEIAEIFEFVDGLCDLTIEEAVPEIPEVPEGLAAVELPVIKSVAKPSAPKPAPREHKGPKPTLRVDLERVDRLINTVGELIINQAMLSQRISDLDALSASDMQGDLDDYRRLARDIQEGVMAIRAQPVKALFQRMARIVREAAGGTGKTARLVTVGDSTEVDKTVIERLADPLTHMIRNAVDHGLEDPAGRAAGGKDETGEIQLSAAHRSGTVLIEVKDDGAGLNRSKIYDIAVAKGLIQDGAELSDTEIDNLLFLPGFSTATEVSNLSGRGVGMDVVKNAVSALGGRVTIASEPGKGTTFSVVLPLTLAVMDGMVISVAGEIMVVPITAILETIQPGQATIHPLGTDGQLLSLGGRFVPIVNVAQNLGLTAVNNGPEVYLLVEVENGGTCALAVDAIFDQRQVVIKSLDGAYGTVPGISAATILGDGKIAMILDPDGVSQINPTPPHAGPETAFYQEVRHDRAS